jgi:transcriptional regulator with XRE-family HTH domain
MGDPLLALMKRIREAHGMSQVQVAACMSIAEDTYRHIEKGRRLLPNIRQGALGRWMRSFLNCVNATLDERRRLRELAARLILEELSYLLEDNPPEDDLPEQGGDTLR